MAPKTLPDNCKRAALYARVSTRQHGQNPETQLLPLRDLCTARGFIIIDEYVDIGISGAKSSRPELDRLMIDAKRRRFDVVLVFRFDRFARSVKHLVTALEEFHALGIDFVSLNESIDTSTPMGKMVHHSRRGGRARAIADSGTGASGCGPGETSRQAARPAAGDCRPGEDPTVRHPRAKCEIDREGFRYRPRHRGSHSREGAQKPRAHRAIKPLIFCFPTSPFRLPAII